MRDDLILLALSSAPQCATVLDKYLDGYSTIQFVMNIQGTLLVSYDEEAWHLRGGQWFFPAHPGPRIRFRSLDPQQIWHHRHIAFQGPLVEEWRAAGLWLEKPQQAPAGRDWEAYFEELQQLYRVADRYSRLKAINGIERMLLELAEARAAALDQGGQVWLETVLSLLARDKEGKDPRLEEIAQQLGWSSTELRRRFKEATGISMKEHLLQGRMAAARNLLLDTDLPLKAIAHRLGYANEFFFSRQFKERTGVAPGAWRQSRQLA